MYVSTTKHRLWVEVKGPQNGTPVLLLHGFPDSSKLWAPQVAALSAAGFRVVAPDMLGYGRSDKPTGVGEYSLKSVVGGLQEVLDQLGIDRAHVVGHDWGASVAWRMAITIPNRVLSLVALSVGHPGGGTSAGGPRQRARWWYFLFFQYQGVAEQCLMADDWGLFREFMGHNADAQALQGYIDALSKPGCLTAALSWYRANFDPKLFGKTKPRPMPSLQLPVLGVWSTSDSALTEEQMLASEQYVEPGSWKYAKLGAGHWIPRDVPDQLNQLLLSFLGTPEGKAGKAPYQSKL